MGIPVTGAHLAVLAKSLQIDPNKEITPYQSIIEKHSKENLNK